MSDQIEIMLDTLPCLNPTIIHQADLEGLVIDRDVVPSGDEGTGVAGDAANHTGANVMRRLHWRSV